MQYNKVEICGINTGKLKVLKEKEKMELLKKAQAGDKNARNELVEGNLRLVLSVVQRFSNRGENMDDLFQVGVIGLIKAIDNFNNVSNQNADIKIKPGAKEGESELVIEVKRSKPWSLFATVDNSGTDETGKVQMTAGFQLSQPFSANDLFYVS